METVELGTTGERVSALCLGTMYFGTRVDEDTARELLDRYYEAGGRFIDTANKYATWVDGYDEPRSERVIGEWIEERGVRDEVFVATKVGFSYPEAERGIAPEQIHREVEKSRERLGIDTIDLLYAHTDDSTTPQVDSMAAFHELIEEGHVRHIGASNFFAWRVARANRIARERGLTPYQCVQSRFSYYVPNRGAEMGNLIPATDELVHYCDSEGLTLLAYSPLLKGTYGREDKPMPEGYVRTENRIKRDVVRELAAEKGVNGNVIVLAWMIQREQRVLPVFGCSTLDQLEANLGALEIELTEDELERLESIETLGEINHTY